MKILYLWPESHDPLRGAAIDPFLDSMSEAVIGGVRVFQILTKLPLIGGRSVLLKFEGDQATELTKVPEWDAHQTHSRIRMFGGISFLDRETSELKGNGSFTDLESVWDYSITLQQDAEVEMITLHLQSAKRFDLVASQRGA